MPFTVVYVSNTNTQQYNNLVLSCEYICYGVSYIQQLTPGIPRLCHIYTC